MDKKTVFWISGILGVLLVLESIYFYFTDDGKLLFHFNKSLFFIYFIQIIVFCFCLFVVFWYKAHGTSGSELFSKVHIPDKSYASEEVETFKRGYFSEDLHNLFYPLIRLIDFKFINLKIFFINLKVRISLFLLNFRINAGIKAVDYKLLKSGKNSLLNKERLGKMKKKK